MEITKTILQYEVCDEKISGVPVIVVAAGSSTRMQGINKQFACISGVPIIMHTLLAFERSSYISGIILVVRTEDIFEMQMLTKKYGISKLTDIVCGGDTRQESVAKGLARVNKDCKNVLIHDGARPLVDNKTIQSVVDGLQSHKAVTCAVKVKDTVKQIDKNGMVLKTIPRENLVAVQTPQGVRVADYKKAIEDLGCIGAFTDDASIMEAAGHKVLTVEGSYKNIKITTPEDISVAETYLKERE